MVLHQPIQYAGHDLIAYVAAVRLGLNAPYKIIVCVGGVKLHKFPAAAMSPFGKANRVKMTCGLLFFVVDRGPIYPQEPRRQPLRSVCLPRARRALENDLPHNPESLFSVIEQTIQWVGGRRRRGRLNYPRLTANNRSILAHGVAKVGERVSSLRV
jgi:hypothetical protein